MKRLFPFFICRNTQKNFPLTGLLLFMIWLFCPIYSFSGTWTSDSIEATVGYGNYVNPGRYTPITVTIKNGYAASGGTIELRVPTNTDDYYTYQKPYPSSPGTVRVTFCVPLSNSNEQIFVLVNNRQDPPQQISLDYTVPLSEEDAPIFFGVLSDNPTDFSYLNQLNLNNYRLTSYSYPLSVEEISTDFYALDNFDCIIIDNFSFHSLYDSQLKSLQDWVYQGGIVLIGDNTSYSEVLLPSSNLSTKYSSISELNSLGLDCSVTQYFYGNGHFMISAFSLSAIGSYLINNQLLQDNLAEVIFGDELLQNLQIPYFSNLSSLQNEATVLTSQVQATTNVSIFLYGFILVVYLLILLPFIYHQLKKRDLISYFRFALPILSITIAGAIFLLSSKTRFSHPFLTYVSIQEYDDNQIKESIFTGIQAPYNRAYSVSIDNRYQLIPLQTNLLPSGLTGKFSSSSNHEIQINYQENDYLLTFRNLVAFNMRNFELEKTSFSTQNESITGNVSYYDNTISGVLYNELGFDLNCAMLALPGYLLRIGNFSNDASVILETCDTQMNTSAKYQPSDPNILAPIVFQPLTSSHPSSDMKRNLLYYYLKQCDLANEDIAYLIGFSDTVPEFQANTDYTTNGLTLVSVPVSLNMRQQDQTYYTSLPCETHKISGDFSEDGEEIFSHFATVRYDIFQDHTLNQLDLFFLNTIGSNSYSYVSKVYFWRNDTQEYEQVYPGKTHFTKKELKKYITSENSLLVQYYTEGNSARLPRMTAIGGKENANY